MNNTEETRLVGTHKKWPWWLALLAVLILLGLLGWLWYGLADDTIEIEQNGLQQPTVDETDLNQLENRIDNIEDRQIDIIQDANSDPTVIRIDENSEATIDGDTSL